MLYNITKEKIPNAKSQQKIKPHKFLERGIPVFATGFLLMGLFIMQISLDFMKKCSKCGEVKSKIEFCKNKKTKDGINHQCKQCINQYYQKNKEKRAEYYKKHKKELRQRKKGYYKENKEKRNNYGKKYYQEHKEEKRKYDKEYSQTENGKMVGMKACVKRRRTLGFNPLNKSFEGSVGHHIDNINVVFIPEKIHLKFGGLTREKHRVLILAHYGSLKNMIKNRELLK